MGNLHFNTALLQPNVTNATSRSEDSNVTQDSNNISKCFQPTTNARHCCAAHVREIHYGGFIKKTQFTILSVRARTRSLLRNLNYIVHLSRIQQKRRVETKGAMETCAREVAKRRSGRGSAGNIYNIGVWCGLCCMLVEKQKYTR